MVLSSLLFVFHFFSSKQFINTPFVCLPLTLLRAYYILVAVWRWTKAVFSEFILTALS